MICQFCAEEIQDQAVVCRYCSAMKHPDGQWALTGRKPASATRRGGGITIKVSAVLFILSGLFSLTSLTTAVPLFGGMREGAIALMYNGMFGLLFFGMGVGLLMMQKWGYQVFMAGTIVYSLDRLLFMLSPDTRDAYLAANGVSSELGVLVDPGMLNQAVMLSCVASLLCWWGFAGFVFLRRDRFCTGGIPIAGPALGHRA